MDKKSGFVAVVGRPNVGKSTLLNCICGGKVSIVSHRQQTTRGVIRQVSDHGNTRLAWLDTPGWQLQYKGDFNRSLNAAGEWALQSADIIVFMSVANKWGATDDKFLQKLPDDKPVIAALNKIDRLAQKNQSLPLIADLAQKHPFAAIIPVCARRKNTVKNLVNECIRLLPAQCAPLPQEENLPFFFAELIREKLFRALGDELPYQLGVIAEVQESAQQLEVAATIYTERDSQKAIIRGHRGLTLKRIAAAAARDMEKHSGKKIALSAHLRAGDWRRDPALLRKMRIGVPPRE